MTTREALIAAIAAVPEDDLPRLVMADWFDENGQPERAEFIRLHVAEAAGQATDAAACLSIHAHRLFTPFLVALDPTPPVSSRYSFESSYEGFAIWPREGIHPPPFLTRAGIRRGFVHSLDVCLDHMPTQSSVGEALKIEPVSHLEVSLPVDDRHWEQFSEPELRQISELTVEGPEGDWPLRSLGAIFTDPHLMGVRSLELRGERGRGRWLDTVPSDCLAALAESPLTEQLSDLSVSLYRSGPTTLPEVVNRLRKLERLTLAGIGFGSIEFLRSLAEVLPDNFQQLWLRPRPLWTEGVPDEIRTLFAGRVRLF